MALLRISGFLGLVGLALSIAGGVLGSPTSLSRNKVGLTLREVAAGIYAGFYVIAFFAHTGAFTYRFYLRTYRWKVRKTLHVLIASFFFDISFSVALGWDFRSPSVSWRTNCLFCSCNLVFLRFVWYQSIEEYYPSTIQPYHGQLDHIPNPRGHNGVRSDPLLLGIKYGTRKETSPSPSLVHDRLKL